MLRSHWRAVGKTAIMHISMLPQHHLFLPRAKGRMAFLLLLVPGALTFPAPSRDEEDSPFMTLFSVHISVVLPISGRDLDKPTVQSSSTKLSNYHKKNHIKARTRRDPMCSHSGRERQCRKTVDSVALNRCSFARMKLRERAITDRNE